MPSPTVPLTWRLIRARAVCEWPAKVVVWLALAVGICVPYFGLQHWTAGPPGTIPVTWLDRIVPFEPGWIWAYASLAVLVPIAPLMAPQRADLKAYGLGLAALCIPCFMIFLLYPVLGPRPVAPEAVGGLYGFIVSVDRPSNSLPSLHAGLTTYSLLYLWRVLAPALDGSGRRILTGLSLVWAGMILYSTLATKQHWLLDLPAGVLLGTLAHAFAGAVTTPRPPPAPIG